MFGSKPSVSGVNVLDFIAESSPKDGPESSCTSKANPSGFWGLANIPIPSLCYSSLILQPVFDGRLSIPLLMVLSKGRDIRILLALVLAFMWI